MKFDFFLSSALAVLFSTAGVAADKGGIRHESDRNLAACETVCIDFSEAGNGTKLSHGDYVKDEWFEIFGMTIEASTTMGGYTPDGMARIYDTSQKGEDPDLESPNKKCGGHGVGSGGEPDGDGPNCNPEGEGNTLIIQESDKPEPDDNAQGGIMTFSFECPLYKLNSIHLIDIDAREQAFFEIFKASGGAPTIQMISGKGGNSIQKERFRGVRDVTQVKLVASNSFGVRSICFCPGPNCLKRTSLVDEQCPLQQGAALRLGEAGPDSRVCPVEYNHTIDQRALEVPVYGRWCGPGFGGDKINEPPPIDAVDKVCMEHDLCWKRKGILDCDCDLKFIDNMPEAILAESDNPKAVLVGSIATAYFSFTFCVCKADIAGIPLPPIPGFGGVCMGVPGVGFATTFVQDLIIQGIGGLIIKGWTSAGGILGDVISFLTCGFSCRFNSSRKSNIRTKTNAVASASEAGDAVRWFQELVCFKRYTDDSTNRKCARCMIGSSRVTEMREKADTMSDLVVNTGLWRHDNRCNSPDASVSEACTRALRRECTNILPSPLSLRPLNHQFGVAHQFAADNIIYSCTNARYIHTVKRKDLNAMFQAPHSDCGQATGGYCTSKAHQYCISKYDPNYLGTIVEENPSSVDPQEPQENYLRIACLKSAYYNSSVPIAEFTEKHGECDSVFLTATPACRSATANWCDSKGYGVGLIMQANSALNVVGVGCWNPSIYPVSTPYGVDPRTKPC